MMLNIVVYVGNQKTSTEWLYLNSGQKPSDSIPSVSHTLRYNPVPQGEPGGCYSCRSNH